MLGHVYSVYTGRNIREKWLRVARTLFKYATKSNRRNGHGSNLKGELE